VHGLLQHTDELLGDPFSRALVGARRVGEAVADHPGPALQRRKNHFAHVLGARGEHEQRFGERVHRLGEQQRAQLLGQRRPAGLARHDDLVPGGAQALGEPGNMRGLARAVHALEGDEAAAASVRH